MVRKREELAGSPRCHTSDARRRVAPRGSWQHASEGRRQPLCLSKNLQRAGAWCTHELHYNRVRQEKRVTSAAVSRPTARRRCVARFPLRTLVSRARQEREGDGPRVSVVGWV